MTQTITVDEGWAYVFVAVEHADSEVVSMHAARWADRFEALERFTKVVSVLRIHRALVWHVVIDVPSRSWLPTTYPVNFQDKIECLGSKLRPP